MVVASCCNTIIFVGHVTLSVHLFDSWIIVMYKFNWKKRTNKEKMEIKKRHFPLTLLP
jgi:hypothetical protein